MRETRLSGSEGGGTEYNRFSLPLSFWQSVLKKRILRSAQNDSRPVVCHFLRLRDPSDGFIPPRLVAPGSPTASPACLNPDVFKVLVLADEGTAKLHCRPRATFLKP